MPDTAPSGVVQTDAVIIGAGPVGLYQAFQLGLLEIGTHLIDALPHAGGQCVELYGDKPIYDVPGLPLCTGRELAQRLEQQLAPFKVPMHLGQLVTQLQPQDDGRFAIHTSTGTQLLARTVFIAAGVGAFQPKLPPLEGLSGFLNTQVFTQAPEPASLAGRKVLVLGDTDAALQVAISLAQSPLPPASITLMHRRAVFAAEATTVDAFKTLEAAGALQFVAGQPTALRSDDTGLHGIDYLGPDGLQHSQAADCLLVLQGLSPKLGPIAHWGLAMERRQLVVDTEAFATDVPGIFAVGDINTYPGKKKLLVCGFHECVLAAFGAAALLFPNKKPQLQYTTTSTRLHTLLGVNSVGRD